MKKIIAKFIGIINYDVEMECFKIKSSGDFG